MTLFETLQLLKRHLKLFVIVPLLFMVAMGGLFLRIHVG